MATRAGKLLAPTVDPAVTIDRPELEARLAEGCDRRVVLIVAGAGFGKSILAARAAAQRRSAWYTLDASDTRLGALATGIAAAIRRVMPDLALEAATSTESSIDPENETDAASRAHAAAALLADALHEGMTEDLLLVLDDLHAIDESPGATRFVEALLRFAPPDLHLLLASRTEPGFGLERLRGQGQVVDVGETELAFTADEIARLLETLIGPDGLSADDRRVAASRIHDATGGWPAAVRLAIEAYRSAPVGRRDTTLDRLQRPDGPLFAYLAEEVVSRLPESARELIRRAVHFDRFTLELLDALGIANSRAIIDELSRRALFLQTHPAAGWYSFHGLIREYCLARLPLEPAAIADLHRRSAAWFEANVMPELALASLVKAADREALAAYLSENALALVHGGATSAVIDAVDLLPRELRDAPIERAAGEAHLIRGDWRAAAACFERASGGRDRLDPATAWRLGLVHGMRGSYDEALAIYDRAVVTGDQPTDEALLYAWTASARYHRGDVKASAEAAARSLERAEVSGQPRALAAAHTALAMSAELAHDRTTEAAEYALALEAAEEAKDAFQIVRVRHGRGLLEIEVGNLNEAIAQLDEAVRLADAVGFAPFQARALANRGRAKRIVGQFEEALADISAARAIFDRIGSPSIAYALTREAELHLDRGDEYLARSAVIGAVKAARQAADRSALAPALVAMAEAVVGEEPDEARRLLAEALPIGLEVQPVWTLIGAARVAHALGDREAVLEHAAAAAAAARGRGDNRSVAISLELRALATEDRAAATGLVGEASAIWERIESRFGRARNLLVTAQVVGGARGRAAAAEAEAMYRAMGARGPANRAAELVAVLDREARPPLVVQALGRFRVLRDGEPIASTAWQSRKARDLLKILVARRGRPTTRETLFELLWPNEDPGPLGNRLSVALATARSVLDPQRRFPAEHFISADKTALSLDLEHVDLDVERFRGEAAAGARLLRAGDRAGALQRFEAAEALYAGDFLEEDPYEDWAVGLREEAQATYIAVARALAQSAAERGDADSATRFFLRILERDPYDEGAHIGLVGALLAAGRHGEARRRYGFYSSKMAEIAVEAAPFPAPVRAPAGATAPTPRLATMPAGA